MVTWPTSRNAIEKAGVQTSGSRVVSSVSVQSMRSRLSLVIHIGGLYDARRAAVARPKRLRPSRRSPIDEPPFQQRAHTHQLPVRPAVPRPDLQPLTPLVRPHPPRV